MHDLTLQLDRTTQPKTVDDSIPPPLRVVEITRTRRNWFVRAYHKVLREIAACGWRARLAHFGAGSSIQFPAHIVGGHAVRIGSRVAIWRGARIEAINVEAGAVRIAVGDDDVIQPYVHLAAVDSLVIGARVMLASRVYITDHDHDFSQPGQSPRFNRRLIAQPVHIGDDVWLGEGVCVLKGVTIGDHSIIGAGSVVTRSIPPYCVAVGNPAKVIRQYSFDDRQWHRGGMP